MSLYFLPRKCAIYPTALRPYSGQAAIIAALSVVFDFFDGMSIIRDMVKTKKYNKQLPLFVEKDEDEFYVVECPLFEGCYSQGKTLDEALKNIRKVIALVNA